MTLTEEQQEEYEEIRERAAVASAKPRQVLNIANRRLESAKANVVSLTEEVKDRKARKIEEATKLKELIVRKKTIEEVRVSLVSFISYLTD